MSNSLNLNFYRSERYEMDSLNQDMIFFNMKLNYLQDVEI